MLKKAVEPSTDLAGIVCYRDGYRVYFGKPSDVTHNTFDALSENIAHEYCMKACERKKWERE